MKSLEDRRSPNVSRVSLTTLVDICTQRGDTPFQAESANVSGRGMQVRTSYLPDVGDELVCRLSHDDQEILVEGRVAWRSEGEDSGEFGIQFTALDADSAHILQALGEPQAAVAKKLSVSASAFSDEDEDDDPRGLFAEGARVKLHIDGLGAPMKACVHQGSHRKIRVGSCLEFLRVGRELQIEDVSGGEQRGAQVDSVNVVINPSTSVPELVVQLRYQGISPTPAPVVAKEKSQLNYDDHAFGVSRRMGAHTPDTSESESESDDLHDEEAAPWEPAAEALRERLFGAAKSAGAAAQKAGGLLGKAAGNARDSMKAFSQRADEGKPLRSQVARSQEPTAKRRQTSRLAGRAAPTHLRSGIHDMGLANKRATVSARRSRAEEPAPVRAPRRFPPAMIFGAAFLVLGGSALVLRSMGGSEVTAENTKGPSDKNVPAVSKVAPATPAAPPVPATKKEIPPGGVTAEVPLFGTQAMAQKPAESSPPPVDVAEAEMRAAAAATEDETWEKGEAGEASPGAASFGRGQLYLPTIHRIRLDGVGAALSGVTTPDGFTILVPGRKAMESGKSIEKRDRRIVAVSSSNGAGGASVKFEFRGAVPPYKVRLRKDFIEFLISAPEDTVARL